jgi:hypothetical protein
MDYPIPPAIYDHAPNIPVEVIEGTPREVTQVCTANGKWQSPWAEGVGACTIVLPGATGLTCFVTWPRGVPKKMSNPMWRHEMGHCNGWANDHPNARYVRIK